MTLTKRIENTVETARAFGWIDGAHHKQWVIDQMLRQLLTPTEYKDFVKEHCGEWDEGIAP